MKLPIRNYSSLALTLFIEPWCDEYTIPRAAKLFNRFNLLRTRKLELFNALGFHPDNLAMIDSSGDEGKGFAPEVTIFIKHTFNLKDWQLQRRVRSLAKLPVFVPSWWSSGIT